MSATSLQLTKAPAVDAIDLSLIWSTLFSIAEEMGTTLRSRAFSEAVREADDFTTGLFDRHGRLISQGNFTPGHLGSMPYVVQAVEHYYPRGTLEPGDSVILNDSWMGSGHFPDFYMVTPVFVDAAFSGYVVNIAHHVDVGGAAPDSQKVMGVTEAFQEGIACFRCARCAAASGTRRCSAFCSATCGFPISFAATSMRSVMQTPPARHGFANLSAPTEAKRSTPWSRRFSTAARNKCAS